VVGDPTWNVLFDDALTVWLRKRPPPHLVPAVTDWISTVEALGPPTDIVASVNDRFVATVAQGQVGIEYLLIEYEALVIVKRIESPLN
jgi:hypothetical protein